MDPEKEGCLAQFYAFHKNPVKRYEYRHLYQDWQATAERIDLLFLVQVHHGLGLFLFVLGVAIPDLHDLGLYPPHVCHGLIAGSAELEESCLDENRKKNNGYAPVTDNLEDIDQQPE